MISNYTSRVLCSHGLGNQLFQLTFAHYLKRQTKHQVIFENNPIFSQGLNYMLRDMYKYCNHVQYRKNFTISHNSLFGKTLLKTGKVQFLSALFMQNSTMKKNYFYNEADLFHFNHLDTNNHAKKQQYFGFYLNWQYVHSEQKTVMPDILKLVENKSESFERKVTGKKTLVVHVRRGDFLTRGNDEILGVIDPNSYKFLIKSIVNTEPNIEIFTITDDEKLAENSYYGSDFGEILTKSEVNEWQALQLMINANYVIAANSTFSWWGAALSYFKNGSTCFIPERFYKNLDDKGSFLLPGLKTYKNLHL